MESTSTGLLIQEPALQEDDEVIHLACCIEVDIYLAGGPKPAKVFCGLSTVDQSLYKGENVDTCAVCELEHQMTAPVCPVSGLYCPNC